MNDDKTFQNWDGSWTNQPSVSAPEEHTWVHDLRMVNRLYHNGLLSYDAYIVAVKLALGNEPELPTC